MLPIPAVIMICASMRGFVIWLFNCIQIYIVVKMGKELVLGKQKRNSLPPRHIEYITEHDRSGGTQVLKTIQIFDIKSKKKSLVNYHFYIFYRNTIQRHASTNKIATMIRCRTSTKTLATNTSKNDRRNIGTPISCHRRQSMSIICTLAVVHQQPEIHQT